MEKFGDISESFAALMEFDDRRAGSVSEGHHGNRRSRISERVGAAKPGGFTQNTPKHPCVQGREYGFTIALTRKLLPQGYENDLTPPVLRLGIRLRWR